MFPLDKAHERRSNICGSPSIDIIDRSGLDYQTHSMGTVLEGEFDEVLDVVRRCYESDGCRLRSHRMYSIKLDALKGSSGRLQAKIASIEEKLGRTIKK